MVAQHFGVEGYSHLACKITELFQDTCIGTIHIKPTFWQVVSNRRTVNPELGLGHVRNSAQHNGITLKIPKPPVRFTHA